MKIPKGWRRLRKGELIRKGDKYCWEWNDSIVAPPLSQWSTTEYEGKKVGWSKKNKAGIILVYFRRKKRKPTTQQV